MAELLRRYLEICLLRAGPQDLPASRFLLGLTLVPYVVIGTMLSLRNLDLAGAITLVVVDTALLGGLLFLLLWARDLPHRFLQTMTALLGTGAVLELVAWPLLAWQQQSMPAGETASTGLVVSSLLLWVWLFWNLMVIGHILRHAVSTLLPIGVALGLLYMFISFSVSRILFFPEVG